MTCPRAFIDCESAVDFLEAYRGRGTSWEKPDVLLLDIEFPESHLSGVEAISALKTLLPKTHIVMLTIRDDAETIYASFQAGASGYLFKEVSVDQIIDAVRQASRGGLMMPAIVANKVLSFFKGQRHEVKDYNLTPREKDVLQEMASGYSQKEIGTRLYIEASTVNSHIQHIYEKLHVRCAPAAVAKAIREGLIS